MSSVGQSRASWSGIVPAGLALPIVCAVAASVVALSSAAPASARDIESTVPPVSVHGAENERYELGPGDKLRVLVYEREDLSGEFTVRPDGQLGLPLLGLFPVTGKDVNELEKEIVAAYVSATGRTPRLLIDVIERRPFYVVGVVQRSGAYPFVPGMTVLHAVALAGGTYRMTSAELPATSITGVNRAIHQLRQAEARLKRSIARAARLVAERDGTNLEEIPEPLLKISNRAEAQSLIMAEKRILQARADDYKRKHEASVRIVETIHQELKELAAQEKHSQEKLRLNNLHLDDIKKLYGKGLQRRSELLSLQAFMESSESEIREINARIARANRALEQAKRELDTQATSWKVALEQELASIDTEISAAQIEVDAARNSIEQMTGVPAEIAAKGAETELLYTVLRNDNGQTTSITAEEETKLVPGDVLRVSVRPRSLGEESASTQQRAENRSK